MVDGVRKASDFADEKSGGKYSESIDKAESTVEHAVDKLAGEKKAPEPSPPGQVPPA